MLVTRKETEISCSGCNGACCRGKMLMCLSDQEADLLKGAGTKLSLIQPPVSVADGGILSDTTLFPQTTRVASLGEYLRRTSCGFLRDEDGTCEIYQDSKRPWICQEVEPGSPECLAVRFHRQNMGMKNTFYAVMV